VTARGDRVRDWTRTVREAVAARKYRVLFAVGLIVALAGVGTAMVAVSWLDNPVQQSGQITYSAADGPNVTFVGDYNVSGTDVFAAEHTIDWTSDQGNVTLSSQADSDVWVDSIHGGWTNTSNISAVGTTLTIAAENRRTVGVSGTASQFDYRDASVDDGQADLVFAGDASVTVRGLPSNTGVAAVNSSGALLDGATTNESGVATFDISSPGTQVSFKTSTGAPVLSNLQPSGNLSIAPNQATVNVSDADFPGDNVTVTLRVDGDVVGTQSISSSGQVTASFPNITAGTHTVSATATDAYGQSSSTSTTFSVPSTVEIWNASAPSEAVMNANVTVFADDRVFERTTTNGTLPLEGLPAGERLVVQVSSDGYLTRTLVIRSLASQQNVYLIPENETVVETKFTLEDKTGDFPPESAIIRLSAPVMQNGTTTYQTVAADYAGQTGFVVDLRQGVRYKISVQNAQGDMRDLGTYTPKVAQTVALTIGDVQFGGDDGNQGILADASLNTSDDNPAVEFRFRDIGGRVDELEYRVVDENDTVIQGNRTVVDPQSVFDRIAVPSEDGEYRVEWTARQDGVTESGVETVGSVTAVFEGINGMPGGVRELIGWILIAAFGGLLVITDSRIEGIGTVVITAILVILGVVQSIPMVAVSLAGTAAVLLYFGR